MRTYSYKCEECEFEETIEQPLGSPRQHDCSQCEGVMKRVILKVEEPVLDTYTPGFASQSHKENRSANSFLTKLRIKAGGEPITERDHLAAERHAGKNISKVVPGSKGEDV